MRFNVVASLLEGWGRFSDPDRLGSSDEGGAKRLALARLAPGSPFRVGFASFSETIRPLFALCILNIFAISRASAETSSPAAIEAELHSFKELGSVLYVAAHPDDENTQLITYLARGRGYRTAYLSLTRGDGGQNVLGSEFGEKLGVARTQELLAARRLDGGQQFFTRAIDFGFSKDFQETLSVWDRQEVLADVVRVIRTFRPDVVITRFSPQPSGTHGHHTASAVLALEAFKLAGEPKAFPEQLHDLTPWQPKRLLWNSGGPRGSTTSTEALKIDVSGNDPVLGMTFADLAGKSRAMHKTQGFGNFAGPTGTGPRIESFQLLAGEPATTDVIDGVDTTWSRIPGGEEVGKLADEAIAAFSPQNPAAAVSALLKLRARLAKLKDEPLVSAKRQQLDHVLQSCLGLEVQTTVPQAEAVPGETLALHHSVTVRAAEPVSWIGIRYPVTKRAESGTIALKAGEPFVRELTEKLPDDTPLTQPYWLRAEGATGTFRVDDPTLIGRAENPPAFPVEFLFEVAGQTLVVADEPLESSTSSAPIEKRRHLDVIPPVTLRFTSEVELFAPGVARDIELEIAAQRPESRGTVQLDAPAEWKVAPANQEFSLSAVGEKKRVVFKLTPPSTSTIARLGAAAEIKGHRYQTQRVEVRYAHIPLQLLQPAARLKAVALEVAKRGQRVGYLPGAGDNVAESLQQIGYAVKPLTGDDLTAEGLKDLDAVVIGVRALNTRGDLSGKMPALFSYVEGGGTVVTQYNNPNGLKVEKIAPFDLKISGERVTDEKAVMTFLAPEHPALNVPNKITPADFEGWVQERGLYFPNQWDGHFTPILACSDAGEGPLKGGLLIAQHGRGYFVYTGLAFFRQLPAGVPGAYRLFANLISLGK